MVIRKKTTSEKCKNLLEKIKDSIENSKYRLTVHALERQNERIINLPETLHVLRTGYEEKRKTYFDNENKTWKYAIRGKTLRDNLDIRIIVAFDENEMLIITVMYVS